MSLEEQLTAREADLLAKDAELAAKDAELAAKDAEIAEQARRIAALEKRLQELTELVGRNSKNSHLPPSSDPPGSRAGKGKKGKRGKRGGKKGHRGAHRELLPPDQVDTFVDVFPATCEGCSAPLPETLDPNAKRYQMVDITPATVVTEYRRHTVPCPGCGHRTQAEYDRKKFPASSFGPRLTALVAMFTGAYHLGRRQVREILFDVWGIEISLGAISAMEQRVSRSLISATEEAQNAVEKAAVKHADGTTWLRAGITMSLWVLASEMATVYRIVKDGKTETIEPLFGKLIRGILISDRATVFNFWSMKLRQVCWAHLRRKFISFSERDGPAGRIGRELVEATAILFDYWHGFRNGTLSRAELQHWMRKLQAQVEELLERAVAKNIEGLSGSCADMLAHREALWTFVTHEGVEPTNNHAERELRPFVLWRKRSFGTQSDRGERFAERVMTVVRTARKQGHAVLDFLVASVAAHTKGATPPALIAAA